MTAGELFGGFSVLRWTSGGGFLSGLLSVLDPALADLTATLAVLALVGWLAARSRHGGATARMTRSAVGALGALALGAVVFFARAAPIDVWRGAILGACTLPLAFAERGGARGGEE